MDSDGNFVWSDGTPLLSSSFLWAPGEPNDRGGIEDCVVLVVAAPQRYQATFVLNDVSCWIQLRFICQLDVQT